MIPTINFETMKRKVEKIKSKPILIVKVILLDKSVISSKALDFHAVENFFHST